MTDYIDREAVIKSNRTCKKDCASCDFARDGDSWCNGKIFVVDVLQIPAADVRPVVRGKWTDMGDFISCSVCSATRLKEFETDYGKVIRLDVRTNFCPNCGADMRPEE